MAGILLHDMLAVRLAASMPRELQAKLSLVRDRVWVLPAAP
jgi:hypothetical protein